jgi:potassium-transporting ATPase KdpC subunit
MRNQLKTALIILASFTLICGVIYPLLVMGIGQLIFNHQSNGSLIVVDGKTYGSELIGQQFDDPKYFWGRLSATSPYPYNAAASSGSNYGPMNPALQDAISERIKALKSYDPDNELPIPIDLVTYSGSGLDPHISIASALYQASRVAKYRSTTVDKIIALIDKTSEGRLFGIIGEPRVNFLKLNLELDNIL